MLFQQDFNVTPIVLKKKNPTKSPQRTTSPGKNKHRKATAVKVKVT